MRSALIAGIASSRVSVVSGCATARVGNSPTAVNSASESVRFMMTVRLEEVESGLAATMIPGGSAGGRGRSPANARPEGGTKRVESVRGLGVRRVCYSNQVESVRVGVKGAKGVRYLFGTLVTNPGTLVTRLGSLNFRRAGFDAFPQDSHQHLTIIRVFMGRLMAVRNLVPGV